MFIVLLILLYIMEANSIIVPIGCFIVAWSLTALQILSAVCNAIKEVDKK